MSYEKREDENAYDDEHVHEVIGNVRLAELEDDAHNHQFAGVTSEAIKVPGGHIHRFHARTDFYEDHYHPITVKTGLQVKVGRGDDARHVHFIDAETERAEGHVHEFIAATLIENPIGDHDENDCRCGNGGK